MASKFLPNQSVVVKQKQLHINSSVVTTGEFISATGDKALVMLENEAVAREVPLDSISAADDILGNISRPGEQPIIDMTTRRSY